MLKSTSSCSWWAGFKCPPPFPPGGISVVAWHRMNFLEQKVWKTKVTFISGGQKIVVWCEPNSHVKYLGDDLFASDWNVNNAPQSGTFLKWGTATVFLALQMIVFEILGPWSQKGTSAISSQLFPTGLCQEEKQTIHSYLVRKRHLKDILRDTSFVILACKHSLRPK